MAKLARHDDGKYIWAGTFEERLLPKEAKFRWDPTNKRWWTANADHAHALIKYADPDTAAAIQAARAAKVEALDASAATSATIDVPAPAGRVYMPYQLAGIKYAINHGNTLIADEMGLGKTIQAIGLINATPDIKTVLIVVPASLKINWKRELTRWLVRPMTIGIAGVKGDSLDANIIIINYDVLKKWRAHIDSRSWDLLICDECHYLKNRTAQRTKLVLGYWDARKGGAVPGIQAARRLFLTGTPLVNRPIEVWPIANALAPETFKSFRYFAARYCDAHHDGWGMNYSGATNLPELQEKLRLSCMIRRLKAQVLAELPAKVRQIIELPENGAAAAVKADRAALARMESQIADATAARDAATSADEYRDAVAQLRQVTRLAFEEVAAVRHQTALAKVPAVIEHIKEVLDGTDKLVVFAHHRDVVAGIAEAFPGQCVTLTGESSMNARQAAVDAFQNDFNVKVFVGNIRAAGVGITLTAASHVVFAELDWTPAGMTQAEDRLHRIGQTNSVLVQHLVLDGTIDARMAQILVDKQTVLDAALDNEIPTEEIDLSGIEALIASEKRSTAAKKRAQADMTPEQIAAIHVNLRALAGVCDGAAARDRMGFNRLDARFGRDLAVRDSLSPGQALAARAMMIKYRGQLGDDAVTRMGININ